MPILLAFLLLLLSVLPAKAENPKFKTSLQVNYIYTASGSSTVKQNFTVTNLTSKYLSSNYEYQVIGPLPGNLTGRDAKGPLTIQTEKLNEATTLVRVLFNDVVAGINRSLKFSLTHDGPALFQKGETREMVIPTLTDYSSVSDYSVSLIVPQSFGVLAYSSPPPTSHKADPKAKTYTYIYRDNLIENVNIQAIFGNFQSWGLRLEYEIPNADTRFRQAILLLPPDLSSQKIILNSFSPPPENVYADPAGNWLALYNIPAKTTQKVTILGQARLIFPEDFSSSVPNSSKISFSAQKQSPPEAIKPVKTELYFETFSESSPDIRLSWDKPAQIFPFLCRNTLIHIKNQGSSAIQHLPLTISSYGLNFKLEQPTVPIIPPQGTISIPLSVCATISELLDPKFLTISADNAKVTYNVPAQSILLFYVIVIVGFTLIIILAAAIAHHAWGIHFQKHPRHSHLRRQGQKS